MKPVHPPARPATDSHRPRQVDQCKTSERAGRRPGRLAVQGGFTLVELMIALTLGLLVVGGVIALFLSNKQTYVTNNALGQVQGSTRVAFELLARDIRQAGLTGCGDPGRIANVLNNGPNNAGTTWYADIANAVHGYDGGTTDPAVVTGTGPNQRVSTTSSIELVGADGVGVSVASDSTSAAKLTLNESSSNLVTGDIVIICDPDHAAIAQATTYTSGSPPSFVHATGTTTPGNCSTGLGFPTQCTSSGNVYQYATNSLVSKLYAVDWFIGNNPIGGKSLYRTTLVNTTGTPTATAQEMVRNVTDMQISYHVTTPTASATSFGTAASVTNWSQVDAVTLTFVLQSVSNAGTDSKPISRPFTTTITLRNRV